MSADTFLNYRDRLLASFDFRDRLARVPSPTLVLAGRHDRFTTVADAEVLTRGIPESRLHVFESSGHFPFIEEAQEFLDVVTRWLSDLPAAAAEE